MSAPDTRYPDVIVHLIGHNGNAFAVLGAVADGLRKAGHADVVDEFTAEATNGDYGHLLRTAMAWVDVR